MFERECRLYQLMLGYARMQMDDVGDNQMTHQPAAGGNPPAWILGHLCVSNNSAAKLLGIPPVSPENRREIFGQGTSSEQQADKLPTKAELVKTLLEGGECVVAAAVSADPAWMDAPHDREFFKSTPIQTVGDLVGHLLTTHIATHLGQLSTWRRLMGKPVMF